MQHDPELIRVYDKYGRELFITKEEWRTNVLPGSIQSNWNDPDGLYGVIVQSLSDGFRADVVRAAEHLHEIDTRPDRGACILAIVLMGEDRLDEAEEILRAYIAHYGEDGVVLTNLAKVYSHRGEDRTAEEILWHALELDPNQENGMGWYWSIQREHGGERAAAAALRKIAAISGSWRAQLWLARDALKLRLLDEALKYYHEALDRAEKPAPADLLMQISGDLGNAGYVAEVLDLCEPSFEPEIQGLQAGNNLIKAHLDLGHIEAATEIMNRLFALKRPDYQQTLSYWDTEIAKARVSRTPATDQAKLRVTMLAIDGPVWLKPGTPGTELFPKKDPQAARICLLGCSAEAPDNPKGIEHQLSDARGRLSRAVPLFFAEQIDMASDAHGRALIPWLTQDNDAGFVLSGVAWDDNHAAECARDSQPPCDYVATTHLKCNPERWTLDLRLIRARDGACFARKSVSFPPSKPESVIPQLAKDLLQLLAGNTGVRPVAPPVGYRVPAGSEFAYYLLRLEQMLAVRTSTMEGVPTGFLNGEREIVDGNSRLCLNAPKSVSVRLLLAKVVAAMKKVRPDILPEFRDKLAALQRDHPLSDPSHGVIQKILNDAMAP